MSVLPWNVDFDIRLLHCFVNSLRHALAGVRPFLGSAENRNVIWIVQDPQIPRSASAQNRRGGKPFIVLAAHREFDLVSVNETDLLKFVTFARRQRKDEAP